MSVGRLVAEEVSNPMNAIMVGILWRHVADNIEWMEKRIKAYRMFTTPLEIIPVAIEHP